MRLPGVRKPGQAVKVKCDPELAARFDEAAMCEIHRDTWWQADSEVLGPRHLRRGPLALRTEAVPAQSSHWRAIEIVQRALEAALAQIGPRAGKVRDQIQLEDGTLGGHSDDLSIHGPYC